NALWILSNVMSGSVDGVQIVIDAEFFQFIVLHLDKIAINSALKLCDIALSHTNSQFRYWTPGHDIVIHIKQTEQIQIIIETGILKILAPLLGHTQVEVQFAALSAVGEIVKFGTSKQILAVVDEGILEHFSELLQHPDEELIEKALFVLGNVTSSTYARSLFLNQNVLQYFSPLLLHPKEQIIQ
ncbi:hypothetical protein QYM36_014776, partial [Artemia franciscana]